MTPPSVRPDFPRIERAGAHHVALFPLLALVLWALPPQALEAQESSTETPTHAPSVVEIEAEDYAFDAPEEIPSGWTNIRFTNTGDEPHLLFIARVPDGKDRADYEVEIIAPFDAGWQQRRAGELEPEEAMEYVGGQLPEWFADVRFSGGVGIIPEGETTEVALDLEPGTYVLECYMKTEEGELHSMEGMVRELVVTEEPSGGEPPEADAELTLSNFAMDLEGELTSGRQVIRVHQAEVPEEGFGHNVHVAKHPEVDTDEVVRWLNLLELDGLQPPPPVTFAGGMHFMAQGMTGYFTVDLEPGRYLFVAEETGAQGVLKEITIDP